MTNRWLAVVFGGRAADYTIKITAKLTTDFAVEGFRRADATLSWESGEQSFTGCAGQAAKLGACIFFGTDAGRIDRPLRHKG